MEPLRTENDLLGSRDLPVGALYGIHTMRAMDNFHVSGRPVHSRLVHAYGAVKLAAAEVNNELTPWPVAVFDAIVLACKEMMDGALDAHVCVDTLQGGAGTSTNMNVNEVLANRALVALGHFPGRYDVVHPVMDINKHQSTNDTYPTALRLAVICGLRALEAELIGLQESFQARERDWAGIVKIGRTQLQDAVMTTLGRQMSAYAEAFARDRWRVYKCEERLRVINLGGTAIGTGLAAPREYIFRVVERLKKITGMGFARAENLVEATQNADVFVEVSGILGACAASLMKAANDIRLMASGPDAGLGEIRLRPVQAGSSIMPGKVNPVLPEAVVQAAIVAGANHSAIAQACGMGTLELNPFLPLVADRLLETLQVLTAACKMLGACVRDMTADADRCKRHVEGATATLTALAPLLGYDRAAELAGEMRQTGESVRQIVLRKGAMSVEQYERLTSAEAVLRLGN